MSLNEVILAVSTDHIVNVFGQFDTHIKKIEKTLGVTVVVRDNELKILGNDSNIKAAESVFQELFQLLQSKM